MNPTAIICLGNRLVPGDDIGCRVYDHLASMPLPGDIVLIDGGLCGLDLLSLMENKRRVVFADAVTGMAADEAIIVLNRTEVAACASHYGHGAGLPYLLHLLPQVCAGPMPEVVLVGAESCREAVADDTTIHAIGARCLELAVHGLA